MTTDSSRDPAAAVRTTPAPLVERAELVLLATAVLQGCAVGAWLGILPGLALRLGGFPPAPQFFVRWAGMLQIVLAVGYALEWKRFRRVSLLVIAKGATAVFLAASAANAGHPTLMLVAVFLEGGMAALAGALSAPADRSRRARFRLKLITPAASRPLEQAEQGQAPSHRA